MDFTTNNMIKLLLIVMYKNLGTRYLTKCLHSLPKFISDTKNIQVGNGQFVSVLFIIPVVVDIHGHLFEIYTAVAVAPLVVTHIFKCSYNSANILD